MAHNKNGYLNAERQKIEKANRIEEFESVYIKKEKQKQREDNLEELEDRVVSGEQFLL